MRNMYGLNVLFVPLHLTFLNAPLQKRTPVRLETTSAPEEPETCDSLTCDVRLFDGRRTRKI